MLVLILKSIEHRNNVFWSLLLLTEDSFASVTVAIAVISKSVGHEVTSHILWNVILEAVSAIIIFLQCSFDAVGWAAGRASGL